MRVLVAAAIVFSLAGCAFGRWSSFPSSGTSSRHARPVAAPFVKDPLLESTGTPDIGTAQNGGESVQFIPGASFGLGIVLRNASLQAVVVTGVRVVEPPGTAVHQTGTILRAWQPATCPPGAMCPFRGFDIRPFDATPRPVEIGAGRDVSVALGFRLGSCVGGSASSAAPSRAVVSFHVPGGQPQRQEFALGTARIHLTGTAGCRLERTISAAGSAHPPLALGDTIEAGGGLLHYVPNRHFALGVVVENRTGQRIVITGAHVLEPRHTLIHQIRARFHPWSPPHCPANSSCIAYAFPLRGPISPTRPFPVARGKGVGVELDFSLGSCSEIPGANPAPISSFRMTYRMPDGRTRSWVLPLGRAELHLLMPKPEDCAQPRSDLRIQGPDRLFTSSEWTRPDSTGDACSVTGRTLNFESRLYLLYARERVYLRLPHFSGKGFYSDGVVTLVARKQPVFRTDTAKVRVLTSTSRLIVARLFAGHYAQHGEKSVPFKIAGILRCSVTG